VNYETTTTVDSSAFVVPGIVGGLLSLLMIVAMWKVFTKAGKPGWAAIIPFYNLYVLLKIAGRPGWWLILFLIPLVNIVIAFVLYVDVAKSFGKGAAFGIFLLGFFSFIGYPILGFGSAAYQGPAAARA
jgi:uncharacterized protein DUF5684